MDGRGGCCIARYSGGEVYGCDMSKVDRIMLRFRPIAPKPVAAGDGSGTGARTEKNEGQSRGGRGKRRYARDGGNKRCNNGNNKKRRASPDHHDQKRSGALVSDHQDDQTVVTLLPLLPETPEPKEQRSDPVSPPPTWLSFDQQRYSFPRGRSPDPTVVMIPPRPAKVVGSSVTVECVTDTWADGNALGRTDEERRMNLGRDTCPGFTSDGFGRVTWTNGAYRALVGQQGGPWESSSSCTTTSTDQNINNIIVWLVMKERLPAAVTLTYPAFTCRVRLQCYVDGMEVTKSSLTVPCDVWRMDAGGFAWRLDVNAALCLGR
ncbi:hypothetical protein L484_006905 [Morus notabilis]|uniref:DUF7950 domain-containing protein n=1 Tax=Morus notabilis TaxID=981085 RepID=W9RQK9_9ROSA|nr:uncharacterized protein LOC21390320 [Morus notabilis]EXC04013.1 hypothetical protein L484_006905 [Morus notabilis]